MGHDVAVVQAVSERSAPRHVMSHLDAIYDNRKVVLAVALTFILIGTGYAFLSKPVYRADILVQLEKRDQSGSKSLFNEVSSMYDSKPDSSGEVEVIGSRLVVGQAVDKLNLAVEVSPKYFPVLGEVISRLKRQIYSIWPGVSAPTRNELVVTELDVPPSLYGRPLEIKVSTLRTFELLVGDLRIAGIVGKKLLAATPFGPIEVRVDEIDAEPGAKFVVKRLSRVSVVDAVRDKLTIRDKGKDADVIRASYDGTDPAGIAAILNAIADAYVRQDIQRKSEEVARSLDFLQLQLPQLKKQVEESEEALNTYRARHRTVSLGEEANTLLRRSVEAQRRRVELEQKRKELLVLYTKDHPAVRSIESQLQVAQDELSDISQQTGMLPPLEQDVLALQRDVQVNSSVYTALRGTYEQLRVIKAGKAANARVVDTAVVPEKTIWPKRAFIIIAALLLGLFCGIAAALCRRHLLDAVNDPSEIEDATGLKVHASVPYSRQESKLRRLVRKNPSAAPVLAGLWSVDPAVEGLRGFRTALLYTMGNAPNRIVAITGATAGVGKSFLALNVAAILGESGMRVLLVDADLHRGVLHERLKAVQCPGLSDLLRGTCDVREVIRRNVLKGVDLLPTGTLTPTFTDLLATRNAADTLNQLSVDYDVVLCDGAPLIPTDAAAHLAALAGSTFLVARQGVTSLGELREVVRKLERIGVTVQGVVMNGVQLRPGHGSYGYGRYRYAADSYQLDPQKKR
ncbi:GNVR domain-containing protein [Caballeronia concitans]|uniref:Tyrosine-protein kinase involved in EPS biosynthesis n=1 Tax=Caballeronia concitans TaxID=1777133 RepID=A0A658QTD5_9BURK|nr:GNVR domain-containing protein [Caballeronia concitans]KIG10843.1 lipopolysaccharide biosynthesis protein [Burkholderia sp. MR1]SAL19845.1 tyrosine-protein kinase involved in EPS biosynthesis [Caballeronia concitans]